MKARGNREMKEAGEQRQVGEKTGSETVTKGGRGRWRRKRRREKCAPIVYLILRK